LRVPPHIAWRVALEGQTVVLHDREADRVYGLENSAAAMWRALAAYGDPERALTYLRLEFASTDETRLRDDLIQFLHTMLERGLLRVEDVGMTRA
jgi:hypothetical protein